MKKSIGSEKYQDLTSWLKKCREEKGLTQRDLGELLDVPHSVVQKVEVQERRLDVYEYVQYCEAIGVDPKVGLKLLTG